MPTGYTAQLDDKNWNARKWMLEGISRAFGVCVTMRDDGHLSKKEIIKTLTKSDDDSYNNQALKENKIKLKKYLSMTDDAWKKKMKQENDGIKQGNTKQIKKTILLRNKHNQVRQDLNKILKSPDARDVTKSIAKFGIEQLNVAEKYDCTSYITPTHKKWKRFKSNTIYETKRSIGYHTKELKEETERNKGRLEAYLELAEDVDKILKE